MSHFPHIVSTFFHPGRIHEDTRADPHDNRPTIPNRPRPDVRCERDIGGCVFMFAASAAFEADLRRERSLGEWGRVE